MRRVAIMGCIALGACSSEPVPSTPDASVEVDLRSLTDSEPLDLTDSRVPDADVPTGPQATGAPCTADLECLGGTCKSGAGFPGGYCTIEGCDGGCVDGSWCSYSQVFGIFCAATCEEQGDCRDGYACREEGIPGDTHRLCTPVRGVADGEPCASGSDCQGGSCLPWVGGYCTTNRCTTAADCANLGGFNNLCVDDGAGGICLRGCADTGDCRTGYLCTDIGGPDRFCLEDPTRPLDDAVFAPSALNVQCGISVQNGVATVPYDIAPDTTSYMVTPLARDGQPLIPRRITLPDQTERNFNLERRFLTLPATLLGSMSPTLVPPGPGFADMLAGGPHTYVLGTDATEVCYYVLQKQAPGARLDLNVYLVGVPNITAATAPSDPNFIAVFEELDRIYAQVGVRVAAVRYVDVDADAALRFGVLRSEGDRGELVKLSRAPGPDLDAMLSVNVFFVGEFAIPGAVVGLSTGLPGPVGLHGTHGSGVIFTAEHMGGPAEDSFGEPTDGNEYTALIIAHELGHWLGLMHTTERFAEPPDQLADTPVCGNLTDHEACPDWGNLMFPFAGGGNSAMTVDQGFVLKANPATRP